MKVPLSALLLLSVLVSCCHAACQQHGGEWFEYEGSCYRWFKREQNWFGAQMNCWGRNSNLVSIRNKYENQFLMNLTRCNASFWLALANIDPSKKSSVHGYAWQTEGDLHELNYFEPLNVTGHDHHDCVHFDSTGQWRNRPCQDSRPYICKAAAVQRDISQPTIRNPEKRPSIPGQNQTPGPLNEIGSLRHTCPPGWTQFNGSCYFTSSNRTNYFNAQLSCHEMGATVASVLTWEEHTQLIVSRGCHAPSWIGLEKAQPCYRNSGMDHCWVWMDDSPLHYTDWFLHNPLNKYDAECVILDGQWKAVNCFSEYTFICKKPAARIWKKR